MEKKTVLQENILINGPLNPLNGGSQALSHTKKQQQELVNGRYFLKLRYDFAKLFVQPIILSN